ncbi:MAG TPA: hypothetical protein VJ021_01150 [Thermoplasmata archaeon]|nr:hypothetical protein [Thermoplasmata archaeon]
MSDHRLGPALSLVRQGLSVGREFGMHSLEALLWVAETVEESVYVPRSLVRNAEGLSFMLANPPLRVGAFSSLRFWVDRVEVPSARVRLGTGSPRAWRTAAEISGAAPLELRPGEPTEVALDQVSTGVEREVTVRLELQSVAIPPLVWFEFTEAPRTEASP